MPVVRERVKVVPRDEQVEISRSGALIDVVTYVIALPCVDVKDRACIDECPVDCIYEGERSLYIHPDECVDCGACEPVCPVEAIYYEDDLPEEWRTTTRPTSSSSTTSARPAARRRSA